MGAAIERLDRRRRTHDIVARRLAAMSDDQLAGLQAEAGAWRASVHGSQSGVIDLDGVKVFVKKISLTDLERQNEGSTANLFDLPLFYQYGVGSAGFGAWRELKAYLRASDWALAGECPHFPMVHHWRVLPKAAPQLSAEQRAWLDRAPDYWDRSEAVRARLEAISAASACIVLFLEYVPETLHAWLEDRAGQQSEASLQVAIQRIHDQWRETATFMNVHGMQHFDLHAHNVLTDGEQVYVADFGLALCADFDLTPAERGFLENHRQYDRCFVAWAAVEWLKRTPQGAAPAITALMDPLAGVAAVFGGFFAALGGAKATPYPVRPLDAALAGSSTTS